MGGVLQSFMLLIYMSEPWCNVLCKCLHPSRCMPRYHPGLIRISAKVWFRDLTFRNGVYMCQPSQDKEDVFEVCEQTVHECKINLTGT